MEPQKEPKNLLNIILPLFTRNKQLQNQTATLAISRHISHMICYIFKISCFWWRRRNVSSSRCAGYFGMAQKVIEGGMFHVMSYAYDFESLKILIKAVSKYPTRIIFSLEVSNLVTLLSRPRKSDYDYYVTWIYVQYYSVYVYSLNTVNYAKVIKKLQNVWSSIIIIIFIAINRTYCTGHQILHTRMPEKGFGTLQNGFSGSQID